MPSTPLAFRDLGLQPYEPVWRAMQAFTDERNDETGDIVWCVQHPPVFTLGPSCICRNFYPFLPLLEFLPLNASA